MKKWVTCVRSWVSFLFQQKLNERYSNQTKNQTVRFSQNMPTQDPFARPQKTHTHVRSYAASWLYSCSLLFLDHFLWNNYFRMFVCLSQLTMTMTFRLLESEGKRKRPVRCSAKKLSIRQALKNLPDSLPA